MATKAKSNSPKKVVEKKADMYLAIGRNNGYWQLNQGSTRKEAESNFSYDFASNVEYVIEIHGLNKEENQPKVIKVSI